MFEEYVDNTLLENKILLIFIPLETFQKIEHFPHCLSQYSDGVLNYKTIGIPSGTEDNLNYVSFSEYWEIYALTLLSTE